MNLNPDDPLGWPEWTDEACWETGPDYMPETDLLAEQISGVLTARSEGRIRFPVAAAEALEKCRDQLVLSRRAADWFALPLEQSKIEVGGHH